MITLRSAELLRIQLKTRIPFRYGIATMADGLHVLLRMTFDFGGKAQTGLAADPHLAAEILGRHRVMRFVELDMAVAVDLAPRFGEARKQ